MKKNQNFAAGEPIVTSTYAGEAASGYIAAALLSANTLDKKLITIMPNVKYKSVIQKLDVSNIISDASCDFATSGSSVSISEQVLTPKELQVNLELCKQEFVDSWEALQLGFSAFDQIPASFNDFLVSYVGGKVAEATEIAIWQGSNTNGSFTGFQSLLATSVAASGSTSVIPAGASSPTNHAGALSGSIDSSNVIAKLQGLVNSIPNEVYGKQDLVIYIPTNVAKAYQTATAGLSVVTTGAGSVTNIGANGYQNTFTIGEKPYNFNGIDLVLCPGLGSNKMVAAQKSNLFFGTGLLSDYNEVRVLDMANLDGSQNYRIIMRYTAGVQFGIGEDIVYYGAY
jgi:hypothetical protein